MCCSWLFWTTFNSRTYNNNNIVYASTHFGSYVSVGHAGQRCRRDRLSFGLAWIDVRTIEKIGGNRMVGVRGQSMDVGGRGCGERRTNVQQNGYHNVVHGVVGTSAETLKRHIINDRRQGRKTWRRRLYTGTIAQHGTSAADRRRVSSSVYGDGGLLERPLNHHHTAVSTICDDADRRFSGGKRTHQLSLLLQLTDDIGFRAAGTATVVVVPLPRRSRFALYHTALLSLISDNDERSAIINYMTTTVNNNNTGERDVKAIIISVLIII